MKKAIFVRSLILFQVEGAGVKRSRRLEGRGKRRGIGERGSCLVALNEWDVLLKKKKKKKKQKCAVDAHP